MALAVADAGGAGGNAEGQQRTSRDSVAILPEVASFKDDTLTGVTGETLKATDEGSEAYVFVDKKAGVVYKVFHEGTSGSADMALAGHGEGVAGAAA
jgi:hypothetical protein